MRTKRKATRPALGAAPLRPGKDGALAVPGQGPIVGMTLSSYSRTASSARAAKPVKHKGRWRTVLKRMLLTILALAIVVGGWLGFKFIYNTHRLFGGSIFGLLSTTKLKGEDSGRVNILLAGNSADDKGHQGGDLTDSIMILSIDTRNHRAFMLSIPRDLYVSIPHHGYQKINAAYVVGQDEHFSEDGYPKGGMGLLEKILEENLGINLNYYALVDYTAFRQAVDAVGGIDIDIQSGDRRGLYDPSIDYTTRKPLVRLSNGWHHLDGQQALDLARARGDAPGSYGFPMADFDRTMHQRQMLLALKSKATSAGVLADPVRLGNLFDAVGGNVKTDFTISEVRRLYDLTKGINGSGIQSISLNSVNGQNLLTNYTTYSGESALVPAAGIDDYSDIQTVLQRLMSNNPVVLEGARIVVLNGTDTSGLATRAAKVLEAKYLQVIQVGDATTSSQTTTQIIDASGGKMPMTKQLLSNLYGTNTTTTNPYASKYDADFIIVLGTDQLTE